LAHALKDTGVIARRNLLRNLRMPQLFLFATVQPVIFLRALQLRVRRFDRPIDSAAAGGKYINYLVPGLLIQVATFGSAKQPSVSPRICRKASSIASDRSDGPVCGARRTDAV